VGCRGIAPLPSPVGTIAYINSQEEHRRIKTFEEEFINFLEKHGIEYDKRYVWG